MNLLDLAEQCVKAIAATDHEPSVVLVIPRGWKAPQGFPRRELMSDAGPHQHPVYRVRADRLMKWLIASGVVKLEVEKPAGLSSPPEEGKS